MPRESACHWVVFILKRLTDFQLGFFPMTIP